MSDSQHDQDLSQTVQVNSSVAEEESYNEDDYDNDGGSDYSIDYEYQGPRYANYRTNNSSYQEEDNVASDLSDLEETEDPDQQKYDMWDEDRYNDFTWGSDEMQLTKFIKKRQAQLLKQQQHNFDGDSNGFWNKEKDWPKQLPWSSSSTNHDQSANALCLVQSNYGLSEHLYAVYRDRIIECGKPPSLSADDNMTKHKRNSSSNNNTTGEKGTTIIEYNSASNDSSAARSELKFFETHQSISLSNYQSTLPVEQVQVQASVSIDDDQAPMTSTTTTTTKELSQDTINTTSATSPCCYISNFKSYTKFLKRREIYNVPVEETYLALGFEPQCLAQKYGYMVIGGAEGEFELYCCMDPQKPVKIWGTKFKGRDNVMLMTNAIQIVRWKNNANKYEHMFIGCMNEAGLLIYHLPPHSECKKKNTAGVVTMERHSHLKSFNGMPINDAKLSPDGTRIICVGDDATVFMIDVFMDANDKVDFSAPVEITIPTLVFGLHYHHQQHQQYQQEEEQERDAIESAAVAGSSIPYSSQYVAWSPSSQYFAHTSDSHNFVLVWRADTQKVIRIIDAAGYTYAISFHPTMDHILVFTNRYGYFHTVDLSKASDGPTIMDLLCFDHTSRNHECLATCMSCPSDHPVFHAHHLTIRHEITMVSFRGEQDTRLRILAKINGIEWSKDGQHLYVATKKRVLAYQLKPAYKQISTLFKIAGTHTQSVLEEQRIFQSLVNSFTTAAAAEVTDIKRKRLTQDQITFLAEWDKLSPHLRSRVLGESSQLASHW